MILVTDFYTERGLRDALTLLSKYDFPNSLYQDHWDKVLPMSTNLGKFTREYACKFLLHCV